MTHPDLYVIRHGETEWNRAGRLQGWMDSPLTEKGRGQARAMGDWLAAAGVADHQLLTSPLGRARQTAAIVGAATGLIPQQDDDLREIGVGDWEGLTFEQITARGAAMRDDESYLDWCGRAPGGEGVASVLARARALLVRIDRPSILVCHGLFSRALRAEVQGVPPDAVDGGQGVIYCLRDGASERIVP